MRRHNAVSQACDSSLFRLAAQVVCMFVLAAQLGASASQKQQLDEEVKALCAQDGGVRVFEAAPSSGRRLNIRARKYAKSADPYYYTFNDTVLKSRGTTGDFGGYTVRRSVARIHRTSDDKVLGESVSYHRTGADLPGPWHGTYFRCPEVAPGASLEERVFSEKVNR